MIDASASLKQLVENRWIRVATIDPASGRVHVRRDGGFEEFDEALERLPVALSSHEWYAGKLQHLPMAWIQTPQTAAGDRAAVSLSQAILVFVVLAPGVVFGVLALLWLLGWAPSERVAIQDHGPDVFRLRARGRGAGLETRLRAKQCFSRCGHLRQLVCRA